MITQAMDPWEWPTDISSQIEYILGLRFSKEKRTQAKSNLGKIVHVCHHKANANVHMVTTGGSIGKETNGTTCGDHVDIREIGRAHV